MESKNDEEEADIMKLKSQKKKKYEAECEKVEKTLDLERSRAFKKKENLNIEYENSVAKRDKIKLAAETKGMRMEERKTVEKLEHVLGQRTSQSASIGREFLS